MTTQAVPNARRWLAYRSLGTYQLLMDVHSALEDFLGAVRDDRRGVAVLCTRSMVLRCLSVRALLADGGAPDPEDPLADPFAGLAEETVREGLSLIRTVTTEPYDVAASQVQAYVRDFERDLGFAQSPPSIRRPAGLFPALRMARELLPLNEASGFPIALPAGWMGSAAGGKK